MKNQKIIIAASLILFLSISTQAQTGGDLTVSQPVISGGSFQISQSVIASGGGTGNSGDFTVQSTIGQPLAGGLMSSPPFDLFSGFWTPELLLQPGTVSGKITYANSLTSTVVPLTTLNAAGSLPLSRLTDSNGDYSLSGFGLGAYTVTPSKNNQVNGISNLDASRIAQHIVGLTTLNANQRIAADTSGNGAISALDAAYIAQFVAAIPNPGQTGTWKFLPANRSYPDVAVNQPNQDYSAILVGDVTGNWNPAGPLRLEPSGSEGDLTTKHEKEEEEKTGQSVAVTARKSQAGGEEAALTIRLTAAETTGAEILGYQFDLLYDAAVIEPQAASCDMSETLSGGMTAMCRESEPGVLKVVMFGAKAVSGGGTLLKLKLKMIKGTGWRSPLRIRNFMFNENNVQEVTIDEQNWADDSAAVTISLNRQLLTATGQPTR